MIYNFELENDVRIKFYCNLFFIFWRIRDDEFVYFLYMIKISVFIFRLLLYWWRIFLSWCYSILMIFYYLFGWYLFKALICIFKFSVDFIFGYNIFSIKFDFIYVFGRIFDSLKGVCLIVSERSCSDYKEVYFKGLYF